MEWRAVIWSSELELYWIGIVIFNGIGVAWREAGGRVEWRGVTPGNDLGLAKNCTIPRWNCNSERNCHSQLELEWRVVRPTAGRQDWDGVAWHPEVI